VCKKCYDYKLALENYYGVINPFVSGKKSWHLFELDRLNILAIRISFASNSE
jgi:hypothetical protein